MANLFLDSSALVKRYVAEAGSQRVEEWLAPAAGNTVHISMVTGAEVVAALVRRQRDGALSLDQSAQALGEFGDDWANCYDVVKVDRALVNRAMALARRHGLRGYDSIQLASGLEVSALAQQFHTLFVFISADGELNRAAQAEGLQVEVP